MKLIVIFIILLPYISFSQINQTDANGLRQGFWQKQQANGKLLYEGSFKDGKPVEEWKRYHEGGQLKALINYEGDSAITQLFDQWKNKMAEGVYVNQKKEGKWIYFSENRILSTENFENGLKNGISQTFYNSGELMEQINWVNDKKEGNYQLFFKTGEPYLQCKMVNNQRNGLCIISFINGRQELVANYKNGLRHGEWKYYNEKGAYLYTLNYQLGKLLNPQVRDSLDSIELQSLEKNKSNLLDPEKFMEDPGEYMVKMKIYQ